MVQRKVPNKLGIQANTKPYIQNHDGMSKGGDLKAKKMKKSRSMKRSELEGSLGSLPKRREPPQQPGKPPPPPPPQPLLSPAKTPSPKKPSPCKTSPCGSPNYMKSTSSSQARKDQTKVTMSISSSNSKPHRVAKSLSKSCSLKKVRTLTKTTSFKHTRTKGGNKCSKVVLCDDLDVKRATCSSNLKDSKFPTYLKLNPGATEAEGTSAMKVCPYNYCSLNGHHHTSSPPLKRFLSSRRRLLKTQKVVEPEVIGTIKAKPSENDVTGLMPELDQNEDFFVEIFVDRSEDIISFDMNLSPDEGQDEGMEVKHVHDQISFECSYKGSDQETFGESSDMEWEEGQVSAACLDKEGNISAAQGDIGDDQGVPDYQSDNDVGSYLEEFVADKLMHYYHEEITEWQRFSDVGSMADSESTQPDEEQIEEPYMIKEEDSTDYPLEDDATICYAKLEVQSNDEQGGGEIIEAGSEDLDSFQDPNETQSNGANEDNYTGGETGEDRGIVMDEGYSTENMLPKIEDVEIMSPVKDAANEGINGEHKETEANLSIISSPRNSEEQDHLNTVELHSNENCVVEVKAPEIEEINKTEELDSVPVISNKTALTKNGVFFRKGTDPNQNLLDIFSKLKTSTRCKKEDDESEEVKEFNPREPNFLTIEPDPDSEKVDLRHQEMDERRNADEWMLDHALQKTVNQLAPARKRKVALLVEAFESVIPSPKWDPHMRGNSSSLAFARPIQACS